MIPLAGRNVRLFSDFWRVVREFNPEEIAREAQQPFSIAVVGRAGVDIESLAQDMLVGAPLALKSSLVRAVSLPDDPRLVEAPHADAVVHVVDATTGLTEADRKLAVQLFGATKPVVLAFLSPQGGRATSLAVTSLAEARRAVEDLFGSHATERVSFLGPSSNGHSAHTVLTEILSAAPAKQLAIGRRLPEARSLVASNIIMQTSIANAQFALLSSLPANIPILGGIIGSGADFLVLTKNQAMMVFRLAALHDRYTTPKLRMLAEIVPVIGAGFLWRTAARTLIGVLPTVVSAVPKTAIAFVGTYLVGRAAQHYYSTGQRPSEGELASYSAEAVDRWGEVLRPASDPEKSQS